MSFGQGGPWVPGGSQYSATPDWGALADLTAARNRRRRITMIAGGALVAAAVATVVATVVVDAGGPDGKSQALPTPGTLPAEPQQPEPTFSNVSVPPPDPHDFIADARKDTAPLSAATLFPDARMSTGAGSYRRAATASTKNCASAGSPSLASVLTRDHCTRVIRATYEKAGVAVTVGVAVFDTQAEASKAKEQAAGNIQPLAGDGVPTFCRATVCRLTTNFVGRYAYFTVAGYTSGKRVTPSDTAARQAARDIANYTFAHIVERGEAQASAAATASAPPAG